MFICLLQGFNLKPQISKLFLGKLKRKIFGETFYLKKHLFFPPSQFHSLNKSYIVLIN